MSKYRIYDLSKEYNTDNKDIIEILKNNGIIVKSHASTIGETERNVVNRVMRQRNGQKAATAPKTVQNNNQNGSNQQGQRRDGNRQGFQNRDGQQGQRRDGNRQGFQNRDGQQVQRRDGNRQGFQNRDGQQGQRRDGNHQAFQNRDVQQRRDGNRQGFQNRDGQQRRDGNNQGFQNRDGQQRRDGNRQGFQNRDGQQRRDGNRQGFQNRDGQQVQRRDGNRQGFQNRDGQQRRDGNRPNRPLNITASFRAAELPERERIDRERERERERNRQTANQRERAKQNERNRDRENGRQGKNGFGQLQNNRNRNNKKNQKQQAPVQKVEIARPKNIKVGESIAVKDLASKMSCTAAEVIKKLLMMGVMASINQEIDFDTATLVAGEFGVNVEELPPEVDLTEIPEIEEDPKKMVGRPPVVTVMGHVDHGKTSLLDVIRKTSVTSHEAGGITQHIGAYQVMCDGKKIVFLDTPGHEAFTAMRARGAQVTDIAVLVVAADDGVMPQTIEAIHHAKSANVPIIVAINKIDKPGADPMRVKNELMEQGLVAEDYGGDTIMVEVSAKKQININGLLEMILLVAEMQELKANPKCDARGVIIEAQLDKGRGPVATVLVQNGTLHIGDSIVAGTCYGKVRAMINDRGDAVKKAGPSVPVEVLGLNDVPSAGDELAALDEKLARTIAEKRIEKQRNDLIRTKKVSLDDLFNQIQEGQLKDLNIVVKADVQGSVEAINSSMLALNKNDEVRVCIVHSGVGAVSESDVMLAAASNAMVIAFNVRPDANARRVAETEKVEIRTYRVIYDALNDVKDAMSGMLAPKFKEVQQGRVEIRQVMIFNKTLMVAGSYVLEGKITNKSKIRIVRDNIEVFDGELEGLRRFKDDVKEVAAGYECGITIKDYREFKEGDIIEAYIMEEVKTSIADVNKAAKEKKEKEAAEKAAEEAAK